jgi:hypothetical protein
MSSCPNRNIREYLDFYLKLDDPKFAILLTGNWGVGKTHFVQQYMRNSVHKDNCIYISLYGISEYDEIVMEIFKQIHPLLASKGLAVAGRIGRGVLHGILKVDLFDQTLSTDNKPNSAIPDYLLKTDYILIFDDLERCLMPIDQVLGYINQYVEHHDYKVILLGNEDEITRINEEKSSSQKYGRIKEKLIGKTFLVEPDIQDALNAFIDTLENDSVKKLCETSMERLITTFQESRHKNLRLYRQALLDFDRLYFRLSEKVISKQALLEHILEILVVLSAETKSGSITAENLAEFRSSLVLNRIGHSKDFDETPYGRLLDTYTSNNLYDLLMEGDLLADLIVHSKIDEKKINQALEASNYFTDSDQPAWIKLYHYYNSTDEEYKNNLGEVIKQLKEKKYEKDGIIKHVFGMLLKFIDIGLYSGNKKILLQMAKENIDKLAKNGELKQLTDFDEIDGDQSWGGLGYLGNELPDFHTLQDYIEQKREESLIEGYPETARKLIELMRSDTDRFREAITLDSRDDDSYYNIPILKYANVEEFLSVYMSLSPDKMRDVVYALKRRHSHTSINGVLYAEFGWLKDFIENLRKRARALGAENVVGFQIEGILLPQLKAVVQEVEGDSKE